MAPQVIQSGTCLTEIAAKHNLPVKILQLANPSIKDPTAILPIGRIIEVPTAGPLTRLPNALDALQSDFSTKKVGSPYVACERGIYGTITVKVHSSYSTNEGVAHDVEIESTFDGRREKSSADAVNAVRKEYGLSDPFREGMYMVSVKPKPPQGQELGPIPLDKNFKKRVYVRSGYENVVEFIVTRKQSILHNIYIEFSVNPNPGASGSEPLFELDAFSEVLRHDLFITTEAVQQGVDPDLVKAIMYMETTHGYYDKLLSNTVPQVPHQLPVLPQIPVPEKLKIKSFLPMNVNEKYWRELGEYMDDFKRVNLFRNPEANIRAGIFLLKRIVDRIQPKPGTVEAIASVYNSLGTEIVIDYGARVRAIYDQKPWIPPPGFLERLLKPFSSMSQKEQFEALKQSFGARGRSHP